MAVILDYGLNPRISLSLIRIFRAICYAKKATIPDQKGSNFLTLARRKPEKFDRAALRDRLAKKAHDKVKKCHCHNRGKPSKS